MACPPRNRLLGLFAAQPPSLIQTLAHCACAILSKQGLSVGLLQGTPTMISINDFILIGARRRTPCGSNDALALSLRLSAGTVTRREHQVCAPLGAQAYRKFYGLTDLGWEDPTTDIRPRCAPSLALFNLQQIEGRRDTVVRGYIERKSL